MLRITTSDINEKVTLKLEGKLSGPWVEEFERCWHLTTDIYKKKSLVVDLSGVTFVDPAGKKLLCTVCGEGAQLMGSGLMPKSLIDEICTEKPPAKPAKAPHKFKQEAAHLLLIRGRGGEEDLERDPLAGLLVNAAPDRSERAFPHLALDEICAELGSGVRLHPA